MASGASRSVLPADLPIVDHHCHLSPTGEGIRAVQRFASAGGTHLFLATQNYDTSPPVDLDSYRKQFDTTEALATRIRAESSAIAFPVVAPYPVDLVHASEAMGLSAAVELHRAALDLAGEHIRQHRAIALGEVGRAHFSLDDDSVRAAGETVFDYALGVAKDVDCPVIVHCEDLDAPGYQALAERARRAGVRPERVVKHYARSRTLPLPSDGIPRSYLARRELTREVLDDPAPWFLETDFLDDPARPGAVLDLETVPKRARAIAVQTPERADRLWIPFEESIRRVYGLSLGGGRS